MATNVIMPKQGLQMTEGTIIKWLVPEGGDCVAGQPLFEMETDKLTITIDANVTGKLLKIVRGEGEVVPITETIAFIGEEGEAIPEEAKAEVKEEVKEAAPAAPAAAPAAPVAVNPNLTKVILPKQGLQMTEGTIMKWLVAEGGDVVAGQPLFEMETDKLTITIDANASGKLLKIVRGEGEVVPITEMIAIIGPEGEDYSSMLAADAPAAQAAAEAPAAVEAPKAAAPAQAVARKEGERVFFSPRAKLRANEKGYNLFDIPGSGPMGMIIERDVLAYEPIKVTPLAKKIAEDKGVDLKTVTGTGSHGKIVKDDVLAMLADKVEERKAAAEAVGTKRGETIIPMKGMRKIIADKMVKSLQTNASLTHTIKVDMTQAAALRDSYKAVNKKISYNDLVLFATTKALKDFPIMNSEITDAGIVAKDYVNIGIAVALDNGLIVPNIKDADLLRLEEISVASKALADKAKNNKLTPEDYAGGTFTISNLGMFGIDNFTAIINTPESGILAVGKIEKTPVVINDQIAIRPIMMMTLTYDHRVVDGAPAAQFIARIKQYLENPYLML
ncbi:MAG: 2-oxo acid dehydrogenase subunit E2 [Christensenellaceae bacterium]|nr:2-oxo acid dehydrogenase subunit E2 [Christensenellaceae bacterium]